MPEYSDLGRPPGKTQSGLKRLRQIMEREGPLARHRDRMEPILNDFEQLDWERHFIAHGLMGRWKDDPKRQTLAFRMYRKKGESLEGGSWNITLDQLKA